MQTLRSLSGKELILPAGVDADPDEGLTLWTKEATWSSRTWRRVAFCT